MGCLCVMPLLLAVAAPHAPGMPADPLATLRPGHPRLILLDSDLDRIRGLVRSDATASRWHAALQAQAHKLLAAPPTKFEIIGPRLLGASRSVLSRVTVLALLYRLDGDEACGRRAVQELVAAAGWPNWNPSHFLDVAELNCAFGLGWDWLQPLLGADRQIILKGWTERGWANALAAYGPKHTDGWWETVSHNWNQVCNGGNTLAALALADEKPDEARQILRAALASVPRAMASYAPDGGWAEGPGYWQYATTYNVYLLAALQTALGTDFGLSDAQGFDQAGDFRLHFVGPSGETFNYADAGAGAGSAPCLFWLSQRFNKPLLAWQERTLSKGEPFDLIWFDPRGSDPSKVDTPLDKAFHGVQVGFLRGSWSDPDATWVAFKGGDNRANHSHLDLGCFVLDALGKRWVEDLGGDDYNLPGYFGNLRWTYYRLKTEGQNTLLINGENQATTARAPLLRFVSGAGPAAGVVDLSAAWPMCRRVQRGVALLQRRDVLVQDEVEAAQPVSVQWAVHTAAKVTLDGGKATLERNGKRLTVRLLAPEGAVFAAAQPQPAAPQHPLKGITKLTVTLPGKVTETRIAVLFSPEEDPPLPTLQPLERWARP
jgi:hypothetical protein